MPKRADKTTSRRQGQSREGLSEGSPSATVQADGQKLHRRLRGWGGTWKGRGRRYFTRPHSDELKRFIGVRLFPRQVDCDGATFEFGFWNGAGVAEAVDLAQVDRGDGVSLAGLLP